MKSNILEKITKYILDFMFFVGSFICLTVPVIFKFIGKVYNIYRFYYIQMCIMFMISGILAVLIIGELRKIFKTVLNNNCFVESNVKILKKMGIFSMLIVFVTIIRLFYIITPTTLVIIIVFFIAGLFSFVLSKVFRQAVNYKIENDLTI